MAKEITREIAKSIINIDFSGKRNTEKLDLLARAFGYPNQTAFMADTKKSETHTPHRAQAQARKAKMPMSLLEQKLHHVASLRLFRMRAAGHDPCEDESAWLRAFENMNTDLPYEEWAAERRIMIVESFTRNMRLFLHLAKRSYSWTGGRSWTHEDREVMGHLAGSSGGPREQAMAVFYGAVYSVPGPVFAKRMMGMERDVLADPGLWGPLGYHANTALVSLRGLLENSTPRELASNERVLALVNEIEGSLSAQDLPGAYAGDVIPIWVAQSDSEVGSCLDLREWLLSRSVDVIGEEIGTDGWERRAVERLTSSGLRTAGKERIVAMMRRADAGGPPVRIRADQSDARAWLARRAAEWCR